jgi:hypothetical protein
VRIARSFLLVAAVATGCGSNGVQPGSLPSADGGSRVFPNLTLQGARSAAALDAPQTISTWEYSDPDGKSYDLLHVMGICMWCPHCSNETNGVAHIASWRADHRVAVLQIAIQGYGSDSPTWADVQKWARSHSVDFPVLIDGQGAALEPYFDTSYVPLNIAVNPRDMTVLAVDVGEVGDVQDYEQKFLPSP